METVRHSSPEQRETYKDRICDTLNRWRKASPFVVRGKTSASESLGIGVILLEKALQSEKSALVIGSDNDLLQALDHLRKVARRKGAHIDPVRGIMIFDRHLLYIVKPIAQRYWTQTAALNDADEVAGTILMHPHRERA